MKNVTADIRANKGGTYFVQVGKNGPVVEKANLRDGYMVALDGNERILDESILNDFEVGLFIGNNWDLLIQPGYYLGAWVTNGRVYLDVSRHHSGFDSAVQIGINNNQKAIWDIANAEEIDLDGMGWHF